MTVCTRNRECLFGDVVDGKMKLNECGLIVQQCWNNLIRHYSHITLDGHIIMPNHIHGIINIVNIHNVGAGLKPAPTGHALSEIVRALKTFSSRKINQSRNTPGLPVWQRNYYDRIIRNEKELVNIREYIKNNPQQWDMDRENPGTLQGFDSSIPCLSPSGPPIIIKK